MRKKECEISEQECDRHVAGMRAEGLGFSGCGPGRHGGDGPGSGSDGRKGGAVKGGINQITVLPVKTPYGYEEQYLAVDGVPVTEVLEDFVRESGDGDLKRFGSMKGLCPAWGSGLQNRGEIRYIHTLLWRDLPVNLPILVCEDDLDLSCIVIVAAVRKAEEIVFWDRIGYVDHREEDSKQEKASGILCLEAYTDEDWAKYGDNIALERPDSSEWRQWISRNWDEELYRRRMNYTLPYCQDERHIVWLGETGYAFDRGAYEDCIRFYERELGGVLERGEEGV